jgi:hypothetical protein
VTSVMRPEVGRRSRRPERVQAENRPVSLIGLRHVPPPRRRTAAMSRGSSPLLAVPGYLRICRPRLGSKVSGLSDLGSAASATSPPQTPCFPADGQTAVKRAYPPRLPPDFGTPIASSAPAGGTLSRFVTSSACARPLCIRLGSPSGVGVEPVSSGSCPWIGIRCSR